MGKRTKDEAAVAQRRRLVAALALKRLSGREIAAALEALPDEERPENCSVATIARDLKVLREEWAEARRALVDELIDEEVARLNELEKVWWPLAVKADREATDRVLAIQRQRAYFLKIGPGGRAGVTVEAGAAGAGGGASGPVGAVKIRVELVDDWRDA
jgi:Trp operon repressor